MLPIWRLGVWIKAHGIRGVIRKVVRSVFSGSLTSQSSCRSEPLISENMGSGRLCFLSWTSDAEALLTTVVTNSTGPPCSPAAHKGW